MSHLERAFIAGLLLMGANGGLDAVEEVDGTFEQLGGVVPTQVIGSSDQAIIMVFHQVGGFVGIGTVLAYWVSMGRIALRKAWLHAAAAAVVAQRSEDILVF